MFEKLSEVLDRVIKRKTDELGVVDLIQIGETGHGRTALAGSSAAAEILADLAADREGRQFEVQFTVSGDWRRSPFGPVSRREALEEFSQILRTFAGMNYLEAGGRLRVVEVKSADG